MRVRKAVQILDRRREYLIERTAQGDPEKVGFFIAETKALDLAIELLGRLVGLSASKDGRRRAFKS